MTLNTSTWRRAALAGCVPVIVGAALGACSSVTDLNETPPTFISPSQFYQNDAQASIAVNGVYAPLMSWNGWKQPAQHSIMCDDDEVACESWMGGGLTGEYRGDWYTQGNSVWFGDYTIIERANEVLKYVPGSSGVTAAMKQTASGRAKFARVPCTAKRISWLASCLLTSNRSM